MTYILKNRLYMLVIAKIHINFNLMLNFIYFLHISNFIFFKYKQTSLMTFNIKKNKNKIIYHFLSLKKLKNEI